MIGLAWLPLDAEATTREASDTFPPDTVDMGVVWTPPSDPDSALATLHRIDDVGATAVRLTETPSDSIATRADTLGIRLYVDVEVSSPSAAGIQNVPSPSSSKLERLRTLSRQHPSIAFVGFAGTMDTTSPRVCEMLSRWTEKLHAAEPPIRSYYVTPFRASADRCHGAVDRVLLDLRASPTPVDEWTRWHSKNPSVGIGALGTWVRPDAPPGLRIPHSQERQARYLEDALAQVLDSTRRPPSTVFVSRWQDDPSSLLPSRRYGLHDTSGMSRPATAVVEGFLTGTQRVFAFPSGPEPKSESPIFILLGWALLALFGGIYTQSLFVRRTITRYFTAHGFYRDALREGRDLKPGLHCLLLGIVVAALGSTGVLSARLAASRPVTERVLAAMPSDIGAVLGLGIEHPTATGITVGSTVLAMILGWMLVLLVARRWTRFSLSQGLLMVVWPTWPALVALPVTLAATQASPIPPSYFALFLLLGGLLWIVYYTLRVLGDYQAVTNVPWPVAIFVGSLSPLAVAGMGVFFLGMRFDVQFLLLWRLATLT